MQQLKIPYGTKLMIAYDNGQPLTLADYDMRSSFRENLNSVSALISAPLRSGNPVEMDFSKRLCIRYEVGGETYLFDAYADDEIMDGIRNCWKIRKISEPRAFSLRQHERFKMVVQVGYVRIAKLVQGLDSRFYDIGKTMDVSKGGIGFYLNTEVEIGEILLLNFPPIESMERSHNFAIRSEVCWMRLCNSTQQRNGYGYLCGLKFIYDNAADSDYMEQYIKALVKERE